MTPDLGRRKARLVLAPPIWGIGRAGNSLVYSEQFRFACETRWPPCGNLNARWTDLWEGRFNMRRRDFITLLGGAAAWPLTVRAQQSGGMRRIGILMAYPESDPEAQTRVAAFRDGLQKLGWTEGRNI